MSFEGDEAKPSYRNRLTLILDEFPSLGRLAIIEEALAYIRACGIRATLIAQDQHGAVGGYALLGAVNQVGYHASSRSQNQNPLVRRAAGDGHKVDDAPGYVSSRGDKLCPHLKP